MSTSAVSNSVENLVKDCKQWEYSSVKKFLKEQVAAFKKANVDANTETMNGVVIPQLTKKEIAEAQAILDTPKVRAPDVVDEPPVSETKKRKGRKKKDTAPIDNDTPVVVEALVPAAPVAEPATVVVEALVPAAPVAEPATPKVKNDFRQRDVFGNVLGSNTAKVNACLTIEGKTMKQIVVETQSTNTWYDHLNRLVRSGKIIREGHLFRLMTKEEKKAKAVAELAAK